VSKVNFGRKFALLLSLCMAAISGCRNLKDRAEWVSELFLQARLRPLLHSGRIKIYRIEGSAGTVGYLFESERRAKSSAFCVRVALDRKAFVWAVAVLNYRGDRGLGAKSAEFLRQFSGKGPGDLLTLGKDVDAVTGATLSCREVLLAVRDAIRSVRALLDDSIQCRGNVCHGDAD